MERYPLSLTLVFFTSGSLYQAAEWPAVAIVPFFIFLFFMASKVRRDTGDGEKGK
jgi:hypothetical protein